MDIFPSPMLPQENGFEFLAATNAGADLRGFIKELRGKVVRVGEGDPHVTSPMKSSPTSISSFANERHSGGLLAVT
jgi:hypothetical protein